MGHRREGVIEMNPLAFQQAVDCGLDKPVGDDICTPTDQRAD